MRNFVKQSGKGLVLRVGDEPEFVAWNRRVVTCV